VYRRILRMNLVAPLGCKRRSLLLILWTATHIAAIATSAIASSTVPITTVIPPTAIPTAATLFTRTTALFAARSIGAPVASADSTRFARQNGSAIPTLQRRFNNVRRLGYRSRS
jgi:hypothetical protein